MMHARLRVRCLVRSLRHRLASARGGRSLFLARADGATGRRRALLVHLVAPFADRAVDVRHQNRWQARELGRLLAARECVVDVVSPGGNVPAGTAPYDVVVDLHPGLTRYPAHTATLRIAYITGSNPAFSNQAEQTRVADLARRRGVELRPRRQVPEFSAADLGACDAMFFIGNATNLASYDGLPIPPVFFVRNFAYPVPPVERLRHDPANFLFLASGGQVHKGLDRLLEIFARHPEWTLHVCSSFHEEPDFCRAYRRELFGCANIVPHGFVALDSPRFARIAQACSHVVLPSCSEANAGSVLSGMAAGLYPLISRECGFSDEEADFLPDCSLGEIESALARSAALAPGAIAERSARARQRVGERYSPQAFSQSVETALDTVLATPKKG